MFYTVLVILLVVKAETSPIIIRTGLGKFDEHSGSHGHSGGGYNVGEKVGAVSFDKADGYNKENEKKFTHAEDGGHYAQEEKKKNEKTDGGDYSAQKFHKAGGESTQGEDKKASHKKGHQKSGFHNTYHKDESGSKSSYYDNSDDEGGQNYHVSKSSNYGDAANQRNNGRYYNGDHYNKEDARRGNYNNGGQYDRDLADRRNYNRERYFDNQRELGRNNDAANYGGGGRYTNTQYYQPQNYVEPYNNKITIYEDPNYYSNTRYNDYNRYYDDGLDVKAPTVRPYYNEKYYDRRSPYDYYYY